MTAWLVGIIYILGENLLIHFQSSDSLRLKILYHLSCCYNNFSNQKHKFHNIYYCIFMYFMENNFKTIIEEQ